MVFHHDVYDVLRFQQALEYAPEGHDLAAVCGEELAGLAIKRLAGVDQADLRDGLSLMTNLLSGPAELCNLAHQLHLPFANRAIPPLREVRLEAAAQRQHDSRLLFELRNGLGAVKPIRPGEAPRHQVPRFALVDHGAALEAGRVDAVHGRKVAGDIIHVDRDRLRHHRAIHPVARDLEFGIMLVQYRHVMIEIAPKSVPAKFGELEPVRIARFARNFLRADLLLKGLDDRICILAFGGPAFAVHPDAVYAVLIR